MTEAPKWQPGPAPPGTTWLPAPAEREVPHPMSSSAFEPLTPPAPAAVPAPPVAATPERPDEPAGQVSFPLPDAPSRPGRAPAGSRASRVMAILLAAGLLVVVGLMIGLLLMMRAVMAR